MGARVACQALETPREVEKFVNLGIAVVQTPQFLFLLERLVERDTDLERNELRDLVDIAVVVSEYSADIAHDGFRGQGAVRDDLRYPFAAVFVGNVLDDSVPAVHAKVDVEIRHGQAF